jgi:hypothetical protein
VDDYLATNHRIGLEEVLCDGCYAGRLLVILADVAKLAVRPLHRHVDEGDVSVSPWLPCATPGSS